MPRRRWTPCLDCDEPTQNGHRCEDCAVQHNAHRERRRGSRQQRGLGADYEAARKLLLKDGPHPCYIGLRGCTGEATTADHIIPRAQGGSNDLSNLQPACASCNSAKGAR